MTSFSTDRLCSDTSLFFAFAPNVIFGSAIGFPLAD
jgi:hypothetical protein